MRNEIADATFYCLPRGNLIIGQVSFIPVVYFAIRVAQSRFISAGAVKLSLESFPTGTYTSEAPSSRPWQN